MEGKRNGRILKKKIYERRIDAKEKQESYK